MAKPGEAELTRVKETGDAAGNKPIEAAQFQVADTRALQNTQPKSAGELADQWTATANLGGGPERFNQLNGEMIKAFKSAYDKAPGGEAEKAQAVKKLEADINQKTPDGKGILVDMKDGKLTVRNLEATQSGEPHPHYKGVFIKDIGPKASADLKGDRGLEQIKPGEKTTEANTKQFPSDALFYKAMNANPEWANAPWRPENEAQKKLLAAIKDPKVAELAAKLPPEMLDAAAGSPKEVNDFLEKKGFGRLLQERPDEEAVAATMSIKKDWTAKRSSVNVDGKDYNAVDKDGSKIYNVDGKPVVQLFKDQGDGISVYAIPADKNTTGYQAMQEAKRLIPKAEQSTPQDQGIVRIPMVDLEAREDLGWLKGMKGGDRTISQAMMQTMLKMDENGFDAKQAIAMGATRGFAIPKEPKYTFNSEFNFVVVKDGQPIFVQPVGKDSWKDPKRR